MAKICIHDILFATVVLGGRQIGKLRLCGIESSAAIMDSIRQLADGAAGLLQVTLRNATQGWSRKLSLYLAPESPMPEGTQLTLF